MLAERGSEDGTMLKGLLKRLQGRPRTDFDNIGRNDVCPCGSGRKFKHCCIDRAEKQARARRDAGLIGSRKA
jgi:hypothetical protein